MSYIDIEPHHGWYEDTIVDFCENILPHFGLTVSYKDVEFSGFWSQGDGASFTGSFRLSDVNPSELKSACPTEVELHELAAELQVLADAHPNIEGHISRMPSMYSHSNTMSTGYWSSENDDEETDAFAPYEDTVIRIFRELANWLYSRLNSEYDFYLADATASKWAEAIEERTALQADLDQLQADVAANPPQSKIQFDALLTAIAALVVEIDSLTSKIGQLSGQFHYWPKDGPFTIEQFYENYC